MLLSLDQTFQAILSCHEEDLQEVLSELPSPEDVDILLHSDLADKTEAVRRQPHLMIDPLLGGNMPPVQVFEIKPTVRMPRRWQPWKFISVAMVIPLLLMHATQVHQPTLSKQVAPPMLRKVLDGTHGQTGLEVYELAFLLRWQESQAPSAMELGGNETENMADREPVWFNRWQNSGFSRSHVETNWSHRLVPHMTGAARADQWLAAAAQMHRPDADAKSKVVSVEIQHQVVAEPELVKRRQKLIDLMMATCFRETGEEMAALQVFDYVIRQADENLFHPDGDKLFAANQGLAEQLREMIQVESPTVAQRLEEVDIDYLPMIVQNWFIDMFLHVLPTEAGARLWDHVLESQGVPLKFGVQLLLSGKQAILSCHEEDLQEVLSELPSRIQRRLEMEDLAGSPQVEIIGPEDVDILLHSDLADKTEAVRRQPHPMIDPVLGGNMPPVQVFEIKPTVRMPRRWQPWKFISVAMVIPWLLMHATQQPTLSKQVAPPMLRKASLPPVLHFVPMHEANWPK
ncbi:unnamed protein product [Cladocopium goreaui]|uniref:Rab-GAP TBC domain-containing protein n=1 Tax=Cladocopium goreaui TaxID=2562237 RepID=A0A9P1CHD3_9DINO|nr:unnamed protein product [Cladocopium goreaui]